MMLTNRRVSSTEALQWGLVNRVAPDAELAAEAAKLAGMLAAGPTQSFGSVKRLLNEAFSTTLETQMEWEARSITDMAKTADAAEGVKSFLERRRPAFTGR
jgi:2-(1,2-epoxy-1,2-dihydrophenyl)acetyl-CoA isomerase